MFQKNMDLLQNVDKLRAGGQDTYSQESLDPGEGCLPLPRSHHTSPICLVQILICVNIIKYNKIEASNQTCYCVLNIMKCIKTEIIA